MGRKILHMKKSSRTGKKPRKILFETRKYLGTSYQITEEYNRDNYKNTNNRNDLIINLLKIIEASIRSKQ